MTLFRNSWRGASTTLLLLALPAACHAAGLGRVRFVVVDPATNSPVSGASVTIEDPEKASQRPILTLLTGILTGGPTSIVNLDLWKTEPQIEAPGVKQATFRTVLVPIGGAITLQAQNGPPVAQIRIVVRASRLPMKASGPTSVATNISKGDIATKIEPGGNIIGALTGKPGVASDSGGSQHVRGEHAEEEFVADGVPLPGALSGNLGSVVVPATIQNLEFLTGAFAPEFGGQTAGILNITSVPNTPHAETELTLQGGSYDTFNGELTSLGPIGRRASYVLDVSATKTQNFQEPQQPDDQTAHNAGSTLGFYAKLRAQPTKRDDVSLTLSQNPDTSQISNRTGLSSAYVNAGEGYGFLGLRNADGTIPTDVMINPGGLGSAAMRLASQQTDGMDITQREVNEYATLNWKHDLAAHTSGQIAVTLLHSGQNVINNNPDVNLLDLPVDNSIEYNPTSIRNVHHVQISSSLTSFIGKHTIKSGLLLDDENGQESYNIVPGSQLALDALYVVSPNLAPAGYVKTSSGKAVLDVNGNPVYTATSSVSPTVDVHRSGFYRAAYLQDTWKESRKFTINYGLRGDWYKQSLNIDPSVVDTIQLSPRLNFAYSTDPKTAFHWSYDRLVNTPPLAQGAAVGTPIQPEVLQQYDLGVERQIAARQTLSLAYYVKQMHDQVDTGLLIPGSEIGIYSAVNFQIGAVHGVEFSYDVAPGKDKANRLLGLETSVNWSYSIAAPNGNDNTGQPAPDFNDHDQRNTVGVDEVYHFRGGSSVGLTFDYGSGLASSSIVPSTLRIQRCQFDFRLSTGDRLFHGRGGLTLTVLNILDARTEINFDSGFSGTRFMEGRRILLACNEKF